jgi:hypothetical protein
LGDVLEFGYILGDDCNGIMAKIDEFEFSQLTEGFETTDLVE